MKYCFFDIECANCFGGTGKICEFGYVVTNESFEILETEEFIINPKSTFDSYVLNNMLAYSEYVYNRAKDYTHFYDKIKRLFDLEDVLYIGHTIDADAKYLNDEAERYDKPYFNYKFYDVREIYSSYAHTEGNVGLETMSRAFGNVSRHHSHRAQDDALTTMIITKELSSRMGKSVPELIEYVKDCAGETVDGKVTTVAREQARIKREEKSESISNKNQYGDNYVRFLQFIEGVRPQGEIIKSELNDKSLTVTLNYQAYNHREMLSLVQLLKNHDCSYKLKASESDYMVTKKVCKEDGQERECTKLNYVKEAILGGKNIKIITFEELLSILQVAEEDLSNMPYPDESSFVKRENQRAWHCNTNVSTTLGDLFALRNINVDALRDN